MSERERERQREKEREIDRETEREKEREKQSGTVWVRESIDICRYPCVSLHYLYVTQGVQIQSEIANFKHITLHSNFLLLENSYVLTLIVI